MLGPSIDIHECCEWRHDHVENHEEGLSSFWCGLEGMDTWISNLQDVILQDKTVLCDRKAQRTYLGVTVSSLWKDRT